MSILHLDLTLTLTAGLNQSAMPGDLIHYIGYFVRYKDLCSFFRLNKRCSKLATDPDFWLVRLEKDYPKESLKGLLSDQYKAKYFLLRSVHLYRKNHRLTQRWEKTHFKSKEQRRKAMQSISFCKKWAKLYREYGLKMIPVKRDYLILNLSGEKVRDIDTLHFSTSLHKLLKLFRIYGIECRDLKEGDLLLIYQETKKIPQLIFYIYLRKGSLHFDMDTRCGGVVDFPDKLTCEFDEEDQKIFELYKLPDHISKFIG